MSGPRRWHTLTWHGRSLFLPAVAVAVLGFLAFAVLPSGRWEDPRQSRRPGADLIAGEKARTGVTLGPLDVSDRNRDELRALLQNLAARIDQTPADAYLDPATRGVIPGLNGLSLEVEETLTAILVAPAGGTVRPAVRQLQPAASIEDFPQAPVYQGNPARRELALVVNVSWGEKYLPILEEILALFQKFKVRGTFFLVGRWAADNPEHVRKIHAAGHELANHGYSDPHMNGLSTAAIEEEIRETGRVIAAATGIQPRLFSPPYGEFDERVLAVADRLGYRTVLWTVDTVDWKRPGADWMVNRVLARVGPGSLVLMHPTEQIPETLRRLLPTLQQQGYGFITVSELLSPQWPPEALDQLLAASLSSSPAGP